MSETYSSEQLQARCSDLRLNTAQLAYLLKVSEPTCRRWLASGTFSCGLHHRNRLEAFLSGHLDMLAEILVPLYQEADWREQADCLFANLQGILRGPQTCEDALSGLYRTALLEYLGGLSCQ